MGDKDLSSLLGGGLKKLTGIDNYQIWKFQVCAFMGLKGLSKVLEGNDPDEDKNKRVLDLLKLLIDPSLKAYVNSAVTGKEAWDNLKNAFEDRGWGRRIQLQRSLWNCRLADSTNMHDYILKVKNLCQELEDIDAEVSDDWQVSIILSGLTPEYDSFITALSSCGGSEAG